MTPLRFVAAALVVLTTNWAGAADEKAKDDKAKVEKSDSERIVGSWLLETSDRKFELIQNEDQKVRLKFDAGKMEFALLQNGTAIIQVTGNYALDDKQTPKLFDVTLAAEGAPPVFAIYEFEGEKLRIRYRDGNGQRPADFTTPATDCMILTLVREPEAK